MWRSTLRYLGSLFVVVSMTMGLLAITSSASAAETAAQRYEQYQFARETINLTYKKYVARQGNFRDRAKCDEVWSPTPSDRCKKRVPLNHFDWTDDGCSGKEEIGVVSLAYRNLFNAPCRLHDFGYRNFNKGLALYKHEDMRKKIDKRFLEEMRRLCKDKYGRWYNRVQRSECRNMALTVYTAVRNIPSNNFGLDGQRPRKPHNLPPLLPPLPPLPQKPLPPIVPLPQQPLPPVPPQPQGPATVTLEQGPAAPAGYRYAIALSGFTPHSSVSITCYDSVSPGGFYSFSLTTDIAGRASTASYCYSGDGPDHWVIAGGVSSNRVTWGAAPPPPVASSISLAQGGAAPAGYWYSVVLNGFAPGSNVTVTCRDSVDPGGFYSQTFTVGADGRAADSTLCYSGDGPDHWVVGGGFESNHVTWGAPPQPPPPPVLSPPPPPSINLTRGAPAPFGYWYNVTLRGFPPGSTVTTSCRDSVDPGGFWNQTFTINSAGEASDSTLCYSGDHPDHWVIGGGVESNHVVW